MRCSLLGAQHPNKEVSGRARHLTGQWRAVVRGTAASAVRSRASGNHSPVVTALVKDARSAQALLHQLSNVPGGMQVCVRHDMMRSGTLLSLPTFQSASLWKFRCMRQEMCSGAWLTQVQGSKKSPATCYQCGKTLIMAMQSHSRIKLSKADSCCG